MMFSVSMIVWTALLSVLYSVPWTLFFLFTPRWGIRLYSIMNDEDCKRIQKIVSGKCTHYTEDKKGYGYCIGKWYLMHINAERYEYGTKYEIWMVATDAAFRKFFEKETSSLLSLPQDRLSKKKESIRPLKGIALYERMGHHLNPYFVKRKVCLSSLHPLPSQQLVMEAIERHYKEHNHAVVYLFGEVGTGKSMVGLFLAQRYSCHFCNDLRPWQPGDRLHELYSDIEPDEESPLVLLFDEVDEALFAIHKGIANHSKIPIKITNKAGWNKFMDEIHWGLYPHLFLIMTSNCHPRNIMDLDKSYLRKGRVNLCFEMMKNQTAIPFPLQ